MSHKAIKMKTCKEKEMSEDDTRLQEELLRLVDVLTKTSHEDKSFGKSLVQLGTLIKTSTSSMTAVPKPLKYLRNSYDVLKNTYESIKSRSVGITRSENCDKMLKSFAEILSVLALAGSNINSRECLEYRLQSSSTNPGDWGHEYIRQLEADIVEEFLTASIEREEEIKERLLPLVKSIVSFDVKDNAEIQACDLCLEIDQLEIIEQHLDKMNFSRICNYLANCANYSEETERDRILNRIALHCMKFGEYGKAMMIGLQLDDSTLIDNCLKACTDISTRKQLSFILARQKRRQPELSVFQSNEEEKESLEDMKSIEIILSNSMINPHFQILARELDILEPKLPEEIYKSWLVTGIPTRRLIEHHDSARANLAASFVSAFVHAGFGLDKLISKTEDSWVYKNKDLRVALAVSRKKAYPPRTLMGSATAWPHADFLLGQRGDVDHGMLSATAALGLIHMWDVDGGLVPIDKYLYTGEDYVKSGALLAIGIVNCGVRNECDPALALLTDYVSSTSQTLRIGAVLGLGIAYAGTQRRDVSELLSGVLLDKDSNLEVASLCAISIGLINVGSGNPESSTAILQKLLELPTPDLANTYTRFLPLGLGIIYMGRRDGIETLSTALEVLPDPYKLAAQTMLQVCSYAGTGDVLIVQELLHICSEPSLDGLTSATQSAETLTQAASSSRVIHDDSTSNLTKNARSESAPASSSFDKLRNQYNEIGPVQAIASLGVSVVSLGEGKENARIFGQLARYGSSALRRAVPLATALSSLSNPEGSLVDILNKYSHDNDPDVVHNAILALGLVGAGTNNARLATMLRHLAAYHAKDPANLFLVRISEGLVHLGKGTLSLCPLRYDTKVLDYTSLSALMVVLVACLDCKNLILGKSHYLLYCLAVAMEPRWLVTLDTNLQALPVSVRVGEAVDVVGKVGNPKVIKAGHVHTTPLLLGAGERAELVDDRYEPLSTVLEGFVVLREKVETN